MADNIISDLKNLFVSINKSRKKSKKYKKTKSWLDEQIHK